MNENRRYIPDKILINMEDLPEDVRRDIHKILYTKHKQEVYLRWLNIRKIPYEIITYEGFEKFKERINNE